MALLVLDVYCFPSYLSVPKDRKCVLNELIDINDAEHAWAGAPSAAEA